MSRLFAILVVLAALGVGAWAMLRPGPPAVVVTDALVVPMGDMAAVTLTLDNQGEPLVLDGVVLPEGLTGRISGATGPLALPAGGGASLAADGAHIMLSGLAADTPDGTLIPLEVTTGDGRSIAIKARMAGSGMDGMAMHGMGNLEDLPQDVAPRIDLSVAPDGDGWTVTLDVAGLVFKEVAEGTAHVPGEGHAHLYLNGLKLGRVYESTARIGPLPPGRHTVSVSLNTHDHRPYATQGTPVRAEAVIEAR